MALQPIKSEGKIGFMSMDLDKLSKEVTEINEQYNKKEAPKPIAAPASGGNLYRQQSNNMLAFLDGDSVPEPVKTDKPEVKAEAAHKFTSPDVLLGSRSQVIPTRGGLDNDGAAPAKQIQSETSNNIWQNKLTDIVEAAEKTSREIVAEQKEATQAHRQTMRQDATDKLVEQIQSVDQRKASNISPIHEATEQDLSSIFNKPLNNMSIFDDGDFERIAEKTAGEKISEARQASEKDDSWKLNARQHTSKDVMNRLFDALSGQGE